MPDSSRPRFMFPQGMTYDVSFSARGSSDTLSAWDSWRFTDWDSDLYSGAYAYDFAFLREVNKAAPSMPTISSVSCSCTTDPCPSPEPMPAYPHRDLHQCHVLPHPDHRRIRRQDLLRRTRRWHLRNISFTARGQHPQRIGTHQEHPEPIASKLAMMGDEGGIVLSTDTGFAEGKQLRQIMMDHFYDSRVSKRDNEHSGDNLESLRSEMLREIGIAKIDNDKRADEILYGMEIQHIREDKEGREVQTFVFDPIPRPIVTQPIKFLQRSQPFAGWCRGRCPRSNRRTRGRIPG